jgi:hypothetical protein
MSDRGHKILYQITDKQITNILLSLIVIFVLFLFVGVLDFLVNFDIGNLKVTLSAGMDSLSFIILTVSFAFSTIVLLLTYESIKITRDGLEITKKTLEKTEIEQQIRDIEQRLEFFYYPMSNYFEIAGGKHIKGRLNDEDMRDRIRAYPYRYRAQKRTREQIEKWYEVISDKDATNRPEIKETLKKYIEDDIKEYEKQIQKLREDPQTLTNEKEIEESPETKNKKWFEFWK